MTKILHSEPRFENHSFMACEWVDEQGKDVFHERTYWPCRVYPPQGGLRTVLCNLAVNTSVEYWVCDQIYKSLTLATKEGEKYGFVPQKGFYCDDNDPHWFPIFKDFDKALAFLSDKTGDKYVAEEEKVETPA